MKNLFRNAITLILIIQFDIIRNEIFSTLCTKDINAIHAVNNGMNTSNICTVPCESQKQNCELNCHIQEQNPPLSYLVYPQMQYAYYCPTQQAQYHVQQQQAQYHVQQQVEQKQDNCCCCCPENIEIQAPKKSIKKTYLHGGWQKRFANMRKTKPFSTTNIKGRQLRKCTYKKKIKANLKTILSAIRGTYNKSEDSSSSSEESSSDEEIDIDPCSTTKYRTRKIVTSKCPGRMSTEKEISFLPKNISDGTSEAAQKPTYSDIELADEDFPQKKEQIEPIKEESFKFLKTIAENNLTDEDIEKYIDEKKLDSKSFREGLELSERLQDLKSKKNAILK